MYKRGEKLKDKSMNSNNKLGDTMKMCKTALPCGIYSLIFLILKVEFLSLNSC